MIKSVPPSSRPTARLPATLEAVAEASAARLQADPLDAMRKLSLPTSVIARVTPALVSMGYSEPSTVILPEQYGGPPRTCSITSGNGSSAYLAHIPKFVLSNLEGPNRTAFLSSYAYFPERARIRIFSMGLDATDPDFDDVIADWMRRFQLDVKFVPKSHWAKGRGQEVEVDRIARALKLTQVDSLTVSDLQSNVDDMNRIIQVLAAVLEGYESPKVYLKDLLDRAALPDRLRRRASAHFTSDVDITSSSLIRWAVSRGDFPRSDPQAGNTIIGSILERLFADLGGGEGATVVGLIAKYHLLTQARLVVLRGG